MLPRESLSSSLIASENQGGQAASRPAAHVGLCRKPTVCSTLCWLHSLCVPCSPLSSLFFWKSTQKRTFLLQARYAKVKSLNSLVTHRQVSHHLFALKTKRVSCWCFTGQRLHAGQLSPRHACMRVCVCFLWPHYHEKEQCCGCVSSERKFID